MENQAIAIDNGSIYTKMGYVGNSVPDLFIPTAIADIEDISDNYNYYIGKKAFNIIKKSKNHKLTYPIKNKVIEDWDLMEKFWNKSLFNYLKADPQEHFFCLNQSPMTTKQDRINIAEIFFETFNVPGIYLGMEAFFSMLALNHLTKNILLYKCDDETQKSIESLTGIVVISGDGATYIVPICDGFIINSKIKTFPITGNEITKFMENKLKERGEKIDKEDLYYAAMELKEKKGYLVKDINGEYSKFDNKSSEFKTFKGIGKISGNPYTINVGYESFLGPESLFSPKIINKKYKYSLDEIIHQVIQECPIEYRKSLYSNILLSGGNTLFGHIDDKLQLNLKKGLNERLKKIDAKPNSIRVNVNRQPEFFLEWLGESCFCTKDSFKDGIHTKEEYLEKGAKCLNN